MPTDTSDDSTTPGRLEVRLSENTVQDVIARRPGYERSGVRTGVVHLGLGAFARAHLAMYLDEMIAADHLDLGVLGVSLRHDDVADALNPQDGLYTLGVVDGESVDHRIVGSILRVVHAPSDPHTVRSALASVETNFVSITVTEKGYCWEPASRRLDVRHPDIEHDIANPEKPRSLPGHLVLMAHDRRKVGADGVTVLSLDNLPANGTTLREVVAEMAAATDPTLRTWVENRLRFPCSMVDRMVPATTDEFRNTVAATTGVRDAWPVRCEPYSQWVVERDWAGPVPPLDHVGVQIVDDVAPWETMKLRVLNGLHTTAALFGLARGLATVDAVVADADGRSLLGRVGAEIVEVLAPPEGESADDYLDATLRRFANAGLGHLCAQIATDTSQKLPQRLLDTVRLRLAAGLPIDALSEVLALWAWSTHGLDHLGDVRSVADPLADRFASIAVDHASDAAGHLRTLLAIEEIFGDLAGDPRVLASVDQATSRET